MYQSRRPKKGETEEDIMKQEAEFQRAKQGFEPAAKAIRMTPKEKDGPSSSQTGLKEESIKPDIVDVDEEEDEMLPDDEIPPEESARVISPSIVERPFDEKKLLGFTSSNLQMAQNKSKSLFAQGLASSSSLATQSSSKGKSLFAQMFDSKYGTTEGDASGADTSSSEPQVGAGREDEIIGDKIHPYLAGMTEADILIEQKKLVDQLSNKDPKLLEFLRNRNKNKTPATDSSTPDADPSAASKTLPVKMKQLQLEPEAPSSSATTADHTTTESESVGPETSSVESSDLPIDPNTVKGFPGMGKVEYEKLAWTGVVKENRTKIDKIDDEENARFGFDGLLLTGKELSDVETYEKGLHHHGEDMEKPGYTMEELMILSRSANNKQKAFALQIIGNIYSKAHTGMYDLAFENSLFNLWKHMDFIYTVRKGLDEEEKTLINESIYCLGNILYPWEEEICLDSVYLWDFSKPHPWISTKDENIRANLDPDEQENHLKDDELLMMDIMEFFVHRSHLLDRLNYYLQGVMLTVMGLDGICKILIRVARHSPDTLIKHPIIKTITAKLTGPNWNSSSSETPSWMVFKVLRILSDATYANAVKVYKDFNVLASILAYLAVEDWKSYSTSEKPELLVLECFRLWISLISQGIGIDEYRSFFPVIMKFLIVYQRVDHLSTYDLVHCMQLFALLKSILKVAQDKTYLKDNEPHSHWELIKDSVACVENIAVKLLTFAREESLDVYPNKDALFLCLSSGLSLLYECNRYQPSCVTERLQACTAKFISSAVFPRVTSSLRSHSIILSPQEDVEKRYPDNFASVNAVRFGGECNPIVAFGPSLQLLEALCKMSSLQLDTTPRWTFLNTDLMNYINDVCQQSQLSSNDCDFFVRFEIAFILQIVTDSLDDVQRRFVLSSKALTHTPQCCPQLFNKLFAIAMSCLSEEGEESMVIRNIYSGYLVEPEDTSTTSEEVPKKRVKFSGDTKLGGSDILRFKKWKERSLQSQWIFEPLQRIRTIVASTPRFLEKYLDDVAMQCKVCLRLIAKCLSVNCDLMITTIKDFATVYCAVCQVFLLGDPRIYVPPECSSYLTSILLSLLNSKLVTKYADKAIFSEEGIIPMLPDKFSNFYQELVREYSENSYFNDVFANYLLLPLRLPESVRVKSAFWTMDTLGFFNLTNAKSLIPLEYLTTGQETDTGLLDIYVRALQSHKISKTTNELLFHVVQTILRGVVQSKSVNADKINELQQRLKQMNLD